MSDAAVNLLDEGAIFLNKLYKTKFFWNTKLINPRSEKTRFHLGYALEYYYKLKFHEKVPRGYDQLKIKTEIFQIRAPSKSKIDFITRVFKIKFYNTARYTWKDGRVFILTSDLYFLFILGVTAMLRVPLIPWQRDSLSYAMYLRSSPEIIKIRIRKADNSFTGKFLTLPEFLARALHLIAWTGYITDNYLVSLPKCNKETNPFLNPIYGNNRGKPRTQSVSIFDILRHLIDISDNYEGKWLDFDELKKSITIC